MGDFHLNASKKFVCIFVLHCIFLIFSLVKMFEQQQLVIN